MIQFAVPGQPQGKGRARVGRVGKHVRMFTPEKTVAYEGLIALAAQDAMAGAPPLEGPVKVTAFATFAIPASWSKKRKAEARFHTGKPDADNIAKAIGDGLNGILWRDDSQVAICIVAKVYGDIPGLVIAVEPIADSGALEGIIPPWRATEVLRPPLGVVA